MNSHPRTVPTLTAVPSAPALGTAPCAGPTLHSGPRSIDLANQVLDRATRRDYPQWIDHIHPAAACTKPIRLSGWCEDIHPDSGHRRIVFDTAALPDGVIYKPCGTRLASACPACSRRYQRDAFHLVRAGLTGGKGVPDTVTNHPAVFATFTAPSFGPVHSRYVRRHTCARRARCDCRPELCHPRRGNPRCRHGRLMACFLRHDDAHPWLGSPLCRDCYDYPAHVVWHHEVSELWRRTTIALTRRLQQLARLRGIDPTTVKLAYGKAAEMQRRAAAHLHIAIRLDGTNPADPVTVLPPPAGIGADDLAALIASVRDVVYTTDPHPTRPGGWPIRWGEQLDTKVIGAIEVVGAGTISKQTVAGYIAKYATKSTEDTGHLSTRLTATSIDLYADPDGSHTERLIDACWALGTPPEWRRLRRWAHRFGFGGHFFTKSRRYSTTFGALRRARTVYRRTTGPAIDGTQPDTTTTPSNHLQVVGTGWLTAGDAHLALASAARAREYNPTTHTTPTSRAA